MNNHTCTCSCHARPALRSRLASGLVVVGRWLATPPGTPVRRPPAAGLRHDDSPRVELPGEVDAFLRSVFGNDLGEDR